MCFSFSLRAAFAAAVVLILSKAGIKNIDSSLGFAVQSVLILIVSWNVVIWHGNLPDVSRIDRRTWLFLILAITYVSSLLTFKALIGKRCFARVAAGGVSLVFAIAFSA